MSDSLIFNRKFHIIFFETLGSFILSFGFTACSFHAVPELTLATAYFLAIGITGEITGGYINPIVTLGAWIDRRHKKLTLYLVAQFIGAMLGGLWALLLLGKVETPYNDDWVGKNPYKFMTNEFFGAGIFTVSQLTITNKFTSYVTKSWQVYLTIPTYYFLVRKLTGSTPLNPAIGLCNQIIQAIRHSDGALIYRDIWPVTVPSLLGCVVGALFLSRLYEPLLLSIKHKEMLQEDEAPRLE